jgi:hypothetical protein
VPIALVVLCVTATLLHACSRVTHTLNRAAVQSTYVILLLCEKLAGDVTATDFHGYIEASFLSDVASSVLRQRLSV